ncbi:hypothetical protein GmHk_01G001102 [Glycine max]|nr:hypothetical protein GmHk_01G001102 [Glycine max]
MMDYVDPIESLDATEIFLGQSLVVVRHWKETVSQVEEKTKVMVAQLKLMKLQDDLDKHVGYLSNKVRENEMLSSRVSDPEEQVKDMGRKMEELSSEKRIMEEELVEMKKAVEKLEG